MPPPPAPLRAPQFATEPPLPAGLAAQVAAAMDTDDLIALVEAQPGPAPVVAAQQPPVPCIVPLQPLAAPLAALPPAPANHAAQHAEGFAGQDPQGFNMPGVAEAEEAARALEEEAARSEASVPAWADSEPGYLEFSYSAQVPKEERQIVEYHSVIGSYHEAVLDHDLDEMGVPDLPELGVGRSSQKGPFQLYFEKVQHAQVFAREVPEINIGVPAVILKVTWRRCLAPRTDDLGFITQTYIDEKCGYIEINLKAGWEFLNLSEAKIASQLRKWGVSVFRAARPEAKMPVDGSADRRKWKPLGAFARTQLINLSVKPPGALADFPWDKHPKVAFQHNGVNVNLDYKLGGNGSEQRCSKAIGCKKFLDECKCASERAAEQMRGMEVKRAAGQGKRAVAQEERTQARAAFSSFYPKKSKMACPFLRTGRCARGSACKMIHEGEPNDWKGIECHLPRKAGGRCEARGNCIYSPCVNAAAEAAAAEEAMADDGTRCKCETHAPRPDPSPLVPPSIEGEAVT